MRLLMEQKIWKEKDVERFLDSSYGQLLSSEAHEILPIKVNRNKSLYLYDDDIVIFRGIWFKALQNIIDQSPRNIHFLNSLSFVDYDDYRRIKSMTRISPSTACELGFINNKQDFQKLWQTEELTLLAEINASSNIGLSVYNDEDFITKLDCLYLAWSNRLPLRLFAWQPCSSLVSELCNWTVNCTTRKGTLGSYIPQKSPLIQDWQKFKQLHHTENYLFDISPAKFFSDEGMFWEV